MVTKSKAARKEQKKSRLKIGKLKLNKETLKDLSGKEAKVIKGGMAPNLGIRSAARAGC